MSSQKPRIIPWLIRQIDNKIYPGLEWVNSEHTQFRVPWKHALRQDSSLEDFRIFEAWAIASGCYDPLTEKPNPPRWKRNFRSALIRKEGIRMILDRGSDSVNPHKIYEINIPAHEAAHEGQHDSTTVNPTSSNNQDLHSTSKYLFEELEQLDLYQGNEDFCAQQELYNKATLPEEHWGEGAAAAAPVFQEGAYAIYSDVPLYTGGGHSGQVDDQESFQQKILQHFSYNSFQTDFEVKIYYRGKLVQTTTVTNPHGFFITAERQAGPDDYLARVYLPEPASVIADQLLVETVNHLLTKLNKGTLVEVREGVICAKRFGSCRSFWSITDKPDTKIPNQIDKTEYTILCSIQQFIKELIDFVEQRRKDSPQYSIWICLGEQWPDDKPWQKKCVMVQVTPVTMRLLHELSYSTGASSLTNSDIKLEVSDSLSGTNNNSLLSLLRSIEDMMDWE